MLRDINLRSFWLSHFLVADLKKGITDGELKKLKAHIDNGDQMDKHALEDYRRKLMDELGRKDNVRGDKRQASDSRKSLDSHRNNNSRFSAPNQMDRDGCKRRNNDQMRRNGSRGGGNRSMFQERNRSRNNLNR